MKIIDFINDCKVSRDVHPKATLSQKLFIKGSLIESPKDHTFASKLVMESTNFTLVNVITYFVIRPTRHHAKKKKKKKKGRRIPMPPEEE